jgi:hypothetical protein
MGHLDPAFVLIDLSPRVNRMLYCFSSGKFDLILDSESYIEHLVLS